MSKRSYFAGGIFIIAAIVCGIALGTIFSMVRDLPQIRALEDFSPSAVTRIYSTDQVLLAELYKKRRDPVPLSKIPDSLQQALIATEDQQFYEHSGVDLKGILRAIARDIMAGEFVEGASTLTQQLAKTLFLTPQKTLERKLKEAFLAFQLERRYTKDEILELYLNQVYFGSGAYGVASAARTFFDKPVSRLNIAECALIAAMPKAPSIFSPLVNPELALKRRNIVLRQMLDVGGINRAQYETARSKAFVPPEKRKNTTKAPYFVDSVKKKLEDEIGAARLYTGGLTVETTLSYSMQQAAEQAVQKGIAALTRRMENQHRIENPAPQVGLIAIDVSTGGILAMIGGKDYHKSPYNRAIMAKRQPGSAFKPIVYALSIEQGFSQNMLLLDTPVAFQGVNQDDQWQPENFSNTYQGEMTLRKALTHSKNIPAVRLIEKLGTRGVIEFSRALGIESKLNADLSLALGTSELTLLELTSAYGVFANNGTYIRPTPIAEIRDKNRRLIQRPEINRKVVMSEAGAAIMVDMLQGVVTEGTGKNARALNRPIGGKTGTTNKYKDALFIGFSPMIAAGVWVGCDDYTTLGLHETGARAALPIWKEFMKNALKDRPYRFFDIPDNVVKREMDPDTGKISPNKKNSVTALFRQNNLPLD